MINKVSINRYGHAIKFYEKIEAFMEPFSNIDDKKNNGKKNLIYELDEVEIKRIIEIDEINMNPIFEKLDLYFVPEKRLQEILYEIEIKGARFLFVKRNNSIVGYMEFVMIAGNWYIVNLQLMPKHRTPDVANEILKKIAFNISLNKPKKIITLLQKENVLSLRLHKKIGFQELGMFDEYDTAFIINGEELYANILKRIFGKIEMGVTN